MITALGLSGEGGAVALLLGLTDTDIDYLKAGGELMLSAADLAEAGLPPADIVLRYGPSEDAILTALAADTPVHDHRVADAPADVLQLLREEGRLTAGSVITGELEEGSNDDDDPFPR